MCKCCRKDGEEPCTVNQSENEHEIEVGLLKIPKVLYLAIGVLNGRYGTGQERREKLGNDYTATQNAVNIIAPMWDEK